VRRSLAWLGGLAQLTPVGKPFVANVAPKSITTL
jgi:hypothetical protein